MTIAAGFNCSDGILLASDTMYTGPVQNTYGPKFWIVRKDDPVVVFGGAGTVGALTRARRELKRAISKGMQVNDVVEAADDVFRKIDDKFPSKTDQKNVQALIGIRTDLETALFQNVYGETALSPIDAPAACLGVDTLGNYFTEQLYKTKMPIKWAKIVAAHLIRNCKKYASGYCGGDTNLIEIPTNGPALFTKDTAEISELEAYFQDIEQAVQALIPGNDPNATELSIQHRRAEFAKAVGRIKGLAVGSITIVVPAAASIAIGMPAIASTAKLFSPSMSAPDTPLPLRESKSDENPE